jgi:hypothetical protein
MNIEGEAAYMFLIRIPAIPFVTATNICCGQFTVPSYRSRSRLLLLRTPHEDSAVDSRDRFGRVVSQGLHVAAGDPADTIPTWPHRRPPSRLLLLHDIEKVTFAKAQVVGVIGPIVEQAEYRADSALVVGRDDRVRGVRGRDTRPRGEDRARR